jgi:hypothetical protein
MTSLHGLTSSAKKSRQNRGTGQSVLHDHAGPVASAAVSPQSEPCSSRITANVCLRCRNLASQPIRQGIYSFYMGSRQMDFRSPIAAC